MIGFVAIAIGALLAERQRRIDRDAKLAQDASGYQERWLGMAEKLRSTYHPKQRAAYTTKAKRSLKLTTRRAGKTSGGARETMARCLEAKRAWTYVTTTRREAKDLVWRSTTNDGWCNLIEQLGLRVAKTRAEFNHDRRTEVLVNESDLTIDFRNGSQLSVFTADRPDLQNKFRGGEKDGVWVDEAQKYPGLAHFLDEVVMPMLVRADDEEAGEIWLSGTAARSLAGLFYEASRDDGERKGDWEVHTWSVVDNPKFGSTPSERWDATAGQVLLAKGWDIKDPPPKFIREWLGKWTKADALYVYAVHARPPHIFAPCRTNADTGAYDHAAAVADLPPFVLGEDGRQQRIVWYFALGADFGFDPAAFAWTLWAFSPDIADIYEMGSFKKHRQYPRQISAHLNGVYDQCASALTVCVGDYAGGALETVSLAGWEESTGLPIEPAEKRGKRTWQEHYNGELYAGHLHYREDSVLLAEQRELQWRAAKAAVAGQESDDDVKLEEWPDRRNSNGERCGNDVSDSALYPYRHLIARRLEFAPAPTTEVELDARRARKLLDSMSRASDEGDGYQPEGW